MKFNIYIINEDMENRLETQILKNILNIEMKEFEVIINESKNIKLNKGSKTPVITYINDNKKEITIGNHYLQLVNFLERNGLMIL